MRMTALHGFQSQAGCIQSDPLNSNSLNSSFLLNSSRKFENFETIAIDTNLKFTF